MCLAVSGTHGKTTVSSLLLWVLHVAGLQPGYLIGGQLCDFEQSAHYSESNYFVIEADEYDTAFFDKRAKFVHYQPHTLIINNLEYDHADIYPSLAAIKRQFHHLLRTVPDNGTIVYNGDDAHVNDVIAQGCWTPALPFSTTDGWHAELMKKDGSEFKVYYQGVCHGEVRWSLCGWHNVQNALSVIAAAGCVGVDFEACKSAFASFQGIKRRLQLISERHAIKIYDDFAHHPTAIKTTLHGLRARVDTQRIIALVEFGSNSMKSGVHADGLIDAFEDADVVCLWVPNELEWSLAAMQHKLQDKLHVFSDTNKLLAHVQSLMQPQDHVVVMSNKSFDAIHQRILQ